MDSADGLLVRLTDEDRRAAEDTAAERVRRVLNRGLKPGHGEPQREVAALIAHHTVGALGELAVARALGLAGWRPNDDEFGAGDVAGYEVRATTNPGGHLIVYGTEDPDKLCVLVLVGADRLTCRVCGALFAREAICYPAPRHQLRPGSQEQYWVPQHALRPFVSGDPRGTPSR